MSDCRECVGSWIQCAFIIDFEFGEHRDSVDQIVALAFGADFVTNEIAQLEKSLFRFWVACLTPGGKNLLNSAINLLE